MAGNSVGSNSPDGDTLGATTSDLISFYGKTPIVQRTGAAGAAITDASGGTAAATNGVLTLTASYNSAILANALATIIAQTNELRATLVAYGLHSGAA
jgi:hypothetical protein